MPRVSFPLIWLLLLFLLPPAARATFIPSYSLPSLLLKSDAVCVGLVGAVQVAGTDRFDTGLLTGTGETPYLVTAKRAVADVAVQDALKGDTLPTHIRVAFPQGIMGDVGQFSLDGMPAPGQRVVLFLKRDTAGGAFRLLYFYHYPNTVIHIGSAALTAQEMRLTPLRRLLLYLTRTLPNPQDTWARRGHFQWIGGTGFLLYPGTLPYEKSIPLAQRAQSIRSALGEGPDLEQFVAQNVLPAVRAAAHDPDEDIRREALQTGAALQDVALIPAIAYDADITLRRGAGAQSDLDYGTWLWLYRVPSAVRPLIALLSYDKPNVRAGAAAALRGIADPLATPFLLDRLSRETNPDILVLDLRTLHDCTREKAFMPNYTVAGQTAKSIADWQRWAITHRAQVKALRARYAQH